ncbi:hypothetical protein Tco_1348847 [Tanacetum coccineum]
MTKDQSILRRNKVNWHFARDDYMFTTIKVVSRREDTQLYGAILPDELMNEAIKDSESYKEYYDIASGAEPPKIKESVKKKQVGSNKTKTPPTTKGKRLKTSAKVAKPAKKKAGYKEKPDTNSQLSHQRFSNDDDDDEDEDDENDDDDDDNHDDDDDAGNQDNDVNDDDDQNDDNTDKEGDDQYDDNEQTESDNDDDDIVHPKLSTFDEEQRKDKDYKEEVWSDDEASDEETQGVNVEEEELDKEETNEEDKVNELYRDMNINLEGRDTEMTDAPQTHVQGTQVIKDAHVIMTTVNPEDVLVTTSVETPLSFDHRLKTLENDFSEFKQTNQFAVAVSLIPSIIDAYLANKMNEAVKIAVQLQSNRLRDEA